MKKEPQPQRKAPPESSPPNKSGKHSPGSSPTPASSSLFQRLFAIDPRSLALFRIAIAALLLIDLAIRFTDLHAMYTDSGMFSRAEISYRLTTIWNWSIHFASGSAAYQKALFALATILALALLAGFETRLATIGSWLMLISIQHRVPTVLSGADILLRMLLFWAMFLPLERAWSLDRWRAFRHGKNLLEHRPILSVASAAILLQMGMMYLFSAIFKSNSDWFEGQVIKGTLEHDFFAKPLGTALLGFPSALTIVTWSVFILEWIGPFLLFLPLRTPFVRLASICALAAMHLGILLLLQVDFFSPVSLAGLALFLPSEFWDNLPFARFASRPASRTPQPASPAHSPAYYLSQGICLIALVYVIITNLRTLPLQSQAHPPPPSASFLRTACGLAQKWNMFDETPSRDGWYVSVATLRDGATVDLLRAGAPIDWTRPDNPAALYPNHRWRKLFREMAYEDVIGYQIFREPVAEYLCREWNQRNNLEKQIVQFELFYCMEQKGLPTSQPSDFTREKLTRLDFSKS